MAEQMIRLYCRRKEGNRELCPSCASLLHYASLRLARCRFGGGKLTCRKCPVHCYSPQMRERMRTVMRWAGPRMVFYHPVAAVRHMVRELLGVTSLTVLPQRAWLRHSAPVLLRAVKNGYGSVRKRKKA